MKLFFWMIAAAIVYTYLGYPAILAAARRLCTRRASKGPYEPSVSIIISAFNEEKVIERKLTNLLALEYPETKLEILVGSDGAIDLTDMIVSKFHTPRIRFFRFVQNLGKPHVLNALVKEARGEVIVFTDSRQEFEPRAVRALVENFNDPAVGCVSGELHFRNVGTSGVSRGMNAYWRYEKFLRKAESDIHSMLGATGAIYAIRKNLYPELPVDILVDDMYIPLAIVAAGYRAVFDHEAEAYDETSEEGSQEFTRKVRTLTGNYQVFQRLPHLFDPFRSPVAFQLFSHKLLRLMAPFALILLFAINAALAGEPFYAFFLAGQIAFYGIAGLEVLAKTKRGIAFVPYTFCLLNAAALMALVRFLTRPQTAAWKQTAG
ncbi:MAG: glycosyltransferase family 2 protein [Candidatus Omnitrophica bacterium]|nr:glycosyltransferase family 2 protein [Candidatus Omnitrophota bacterium]